ncbi:serpin B11-like [Gordionus sp. m RMFG-2023]|uniref:serpin B11-like n=1 Tax=Gordionus sp. m RMFG-2023 TaxID=3053472 RepID=UPI0031FBF717
MKIKPESCHSHTAHDSNLSLQVSADNQFSIDVLKTLLLSDIKGEEKNLILSPVIASQVLSMLLLGSKGITFTQLAHTLHYDKILKDTSQLTPKNQETLHETIKEMSNALTKLSSKNVTLDIGNGLYPDNLFPLDSNYVKIIKELLDQFIKNLTQEKLDWLVKELRLEQQIRVTIPVFKVSYEAALKETLQALGSVDVFGVNADLSGITNASGVGQNLYLNQMYHKAFIEVNEEGSEAAAASGAVVGVRSIQIPLQFLADRPFLYFIINMDNGSMLFVGTFIIPG